ncbi:hypothetical protein [Rhizobium sp. SL86]|uniref:hypothetical protein n=1 Tax=Rhizobium sp. SL86 TaxID=2995148 RepID=UPI0022761E39|nr:hypothetical protein [Rhizobium sp. SL86]MCY1666180.1 hypothetical protein [Rhizobium sp. SL86]
MAAAWRPIADKEEQIIKLLLSQGFPGNANKAMHESAVLKMKTVGASSLVRQPRRLT